MTTAVREILLALFIFVLIAWAWQWMRAAAGSPKGWIKTLVTIAMIAILGPPLWHWIKDYMKAAKAPPVVVVSHPRAPTDRPWLYVTEESAGYYDGEIHPTESQMVMIEDNDDQLTFRVSYDSLDKTESVYFHLDRTKELGIWTKDKPTKVSGTWRLKDERFQLIKDGHCIAWHVDGKDTNAWVDAYLKPQ